MADNKTMVNSEGKAPGRTVEIQMDPEGTPATPGSYHEYQGSKSVANENGYKGRLSAIEAALGNKDSVKG